MATINFSKNLSFSTAIHYGNFASTTIEKNQQNIDDYFCLSGKKACVVSTDSILNTDTAKWAPVKFSFSMTLLKIVSYLTVICPLIMLLAKVINRALLPHRVVLIGKPTGITLTDTAPVARIARATNSIAATILSATSQAVPSKPGTIPHKPPSGKITLATIPTIILPDNTSLTAPLSGGPSPRNPQSGNSQVILKQTSSLKTIQKQVPARTLPKQLSWNQILAKKQAEINLECEAGRGLQVLDTVQTQLDANITDIVCRKMKKPGFQWVASPYLRNKLVFSFEDMPNVVFKVGNPKYNTATAALNPNNPIEYENLYQANKAISECFQNILNAKKFSMDKKWDCLVLPKAQKFTVKDEYGNSYVVLAEERLNFTSNIDEQKELYNDPNITETIRQFAEFVAELGFWDVEYRNAPILNEVPGYKGPKRIGLIDLYNMQRDPVNLTKGMFGVPRPLAKPPGLCVPAGVVNLVYFKEHVEAILQIAKNRGIDDLFETAQRRLKWIEEQQAAAVAI